MIDPLKRTVVFRTPIQIKPTDKLQVILKGVQVAKVRRIRNGKPGPWVAVRRGVAAALVILAPWIVSGQVCIDTTTYRVEPSTSDYVAPASTTTLKADLLKKLYESWYEKDRARFLWYQALGDNFDLQDQNGKLRAMLLISTSTCQPKP